MLEVFIEKSGNISVARTIQRKLTLVAINEPVATSASFYVDLLKVADSKNLLTT